MFAMDVQRAAKEHRYRQRAIQRARLSRSRDVDTSDAKELTRAQEETVQVDVLRMRNGAYPLYKENKLKVSQRLTIEEVQPCTIPKVRFYDDGFINQGSGRVVWAIPEAKKEEDLVLLDKNVRLREMDNGGDIGESMALSRNVNIGFGCRRPKRRQTEKEIHVPTVKDDSRAIPLPEKKGIYLESKVDAEIIDCRDELKRIRGDLDECHTHGSSEYSESLIDMTKYLKNTCRRIDYLRRVGSARLDMIDI